MAWKYNPFTSKQDYYKKIPLLPDFTINFDTEDPNTPGTIFTPDDQLNTDAIYVSSVNDSLWTSDGITYQNYIALTAWYLNGTTIDAGSNKTADISRTGKVYVGGITVNNAYTLPTTDGTANYFLKTNGSGTVTWGVAGLSFFTEAQATAAPNATVYANSLTAVSTTTNADFVIRPKGTGSILAAIPDNAILGGNKRGTNAVDLQTFRDATTQVASGAYSALIGGYANKATGAYSFAFGTYSNASGQTSSALGSGCTASGDTCMALISQATASGQFSFASGRYAGASGTSAVAIGQNTGASGFYSLALGQESVSSNTTSISIGKATTADGISSLALGIKSHTFGVTGRQVFQSGDSSTAGDAQKSTLILRRTTTDATASVLSVTGNATITSQIQLTLQNNNVFRVKGSITGKQSGSTNVGVWDIDCVIVRGANAASTVIASSNVNLVVNTGSFGNPTLTANTTLGCLTVTVIGALATNVQWTSVLETCEVIY